MTNTNTISHNEFITIANTITGFAAGWNRKLGAMTGINPATLYGAKRHGRGFKGDKAAALRRVASAFVPTEAPVDADAPVTVTDATGIVTVTDDRTDDQILADITERFEVMADLIDMAIANTVTSVIVTGPGGIGKTFPIERALERAMVDDNRPFVAVSGSISPVEIFAAAHAVKDGGVLLIDDADAAMESPEGMNILKALTDTKRHRVVSWMKQNKSLEQREIEPQFEFQGSVIIISNADVRAVANGTTKRAGHMDAVLSRALHIDLGINSPRELAIRVRHMIEDQDMLQHTLATFGIVDTDDSTEYTDLKNEIGAFIKDNADAFRSLTLREADKLARTAGGAIMAGKDWKRIARLTLGVL